MTDTRSSSGSAGDLALCGVIADAIRDYCNKVSPAAVQDSHGKERIYYSGIDLQALAEAIFAALPSSAQGPILTKRSEEDRLRYVMQKIAEFPYIGEKAAQQMQLLAKGALALSSTDHRSCHDHPSRRCAPDDCCQSVTSTDELVERVAKAIFASDMKWLPVLEHQFEENRIVYLKAARAAIDAMREPTEAMLDAGDSMMPQIAKGQDITTGYDALREAWPAMIAAVVSPADRETPNAG